MNIVGEENDTPPIINKHNIVIETKWNGFRMMDDASFTKWETIFIFPVSVFLALPGSLGSLSHWQS